MTPLDAIVLGIAQGLTEFLPISSDGHLAIATQILGLTPDLDFVVFLHGATLIAMYVYFWSDIVRLATSLLPSNRDRHAGDRRLVLLIVAGTFASGVVALVLEPVVEPMSGSLVWVGVWFLATATLLTLGEALASRVSAVPHTSALSAPRALFVGTLQGLAVLPGLSRSGSTIAAGMLSGLSRERAARFSFLLGIPIITIAALRDWVGLFSGATTLPPFVVSAAGFLAAGVSGYLAIYVLLRFVRSHRLYPFAVYTGVLGTAILVYATTVSGG